MTRSLFIRRITEFFLIMTTRDVSHLVKGTLEAIVVLRMVLIDWIMTLSKRCIQVYYRCCLILVMIYNDRGVCARGGGGGGGSCTFFPLSET